MLNVPVCDEAPSASRPRPSRSCLAGMLAGRRELEGSKWACWLVGIITSMGDEVNEAGLVVRVAQVDSEFLSMNECTKRPTGRNRKRTQWCSWRGASGPWYRTVIPSAWCDVQYSPTSKGFWRQGQGTQKGILGGTIWVSSEVWTESGGTDEAKDSTCGGLTSWLVGLSWGSRGVVLRTTVK